MANFDSIVDYFIYIVDGYHSRRGIFPRSVHMPLYDAELLDKFYDFLPEKYKTIDIKGISNLDHWITSGPKELN